MVIGITDTFIWQKKTQIMCLDSVYQKFTMFTIQDEIASIL